ncbi:MAG: hypoxanthine phosphoribosyltransferase [Actinobacteria bacterium]|nr:hypoxanthine phosphoribosyltransferase [Actinomycetota bacterium]
MQVPLDRVLFSEEEIASRVRELGERITRDYRSLRGPGAELVLVNVLKGGFVFLADLVRCLDLDVVVDFLAITSYGGREGSVGGVRFVKDLSESIYRRDVLVVEDIVDTGLTLGFILRNLASRQPASLRVCTFLDRSSSRIVPLEVDYRCFEVGGEFVVGYGLDYGQKWRNLKYVCTLRAAELA